MKFLKFLKIVDKLLTPGGYFIFTCFNGKRVFNMLKQGQIDIVEVGVTKFSIKQNYKSNTLTDFGQAIGVQLPFSQGEYYQEYLVNIEAVTKLFMTMKYKLVENKPFDSKLKQYQAKTKLTLGDVDYIKLHDWCIFQKPSI